MVPRGGVEPPTLRFSEAERIWPIKGLAFGKLEKRAGFGLWMANAYRFGMGRITRYPSKSNTKYLHEVRVGTYTVDQAWLWEEVERVAGHAGYKKRSRFWACTIIAFDTKEKADKLEYQVRDRREYEERLEAKKRPCPVRIRYEEAARAQHVVIWSLSTGIIRDVVRSYRRERADCSTHGYPNMAAARVIVAAAPAIDIDRAREMVDQMLAWVIARHGAWFWTGLQGERTLKLHA